MAADCIGIKRNTGHLVARIDIAEKTVEISLTQGKSTIIDLADLPLVATRTWYAWQSRKSGLWYARSASCDYPIMLHRVLMDAPPGSIVDHANGNGLFNRRHNLRFATSQGNGANARISTSNTSGYKGVCWDTRRGGWRAYIICSDSKGRQRYLGTFLDKEQAARAYDAAARQLFGEFARCNFPAA